MGENALHMFADVLIMPGFLRRCALVERDRFSSVTAVMIDEKRPNKSNARVEIRVKDGPLYRHGTRDSRPVALNFSAAEARSAVFSGSSIWKSSSAALPSSVA